ncbi:MAG: TraR/DksA family transcriptional regulator [Acidimicrobiales bacterium]
MPDEMSARPAGGGAGDGSDPPAPADTAALAVDLAALDEAEADLEDLDVALRRLEDGTYGLCELCGDALPAPDLERRPLARRCQHHSA